MRRRSCAAGTPMSGPVLLLAASGLAREVMALLREVGTKVLGVLDDRYLALPPEVDGLPVLGALDDARGFRDAQLLVCVGSGAGRAAVVNRLMCAGVDSPQYATVVDPSVRNPAGCPVGAGSILLAGVTLTADAAIGEHVVVMPQATITHDCRVDDFVTLAAGVSLGGGVRVGRGAYVGMNASVRQGVSIGPGATVGMGAVVLTDIPDAETWVGMPARPITQRSSSQQMSERRAGR